MKKNIINEVTIIGPGLIGSSLGLALKKKKIVIFSAIDNLLKGASGQAVQNMNLIYKFPEYLGLK